MSEREKESIRECSQKKRTQKKNEHFDPHLPSHVLKSGNVLREWLCTLSYIYTYIHEYIHTYIYIYIDIDMT